MDCDPCQTDEMQIDIGTVVSGQQCASIGVPVRSFHSNNYTMNSDVVGIAYPIVSATSTEDIMSVEMASALNCSANHILRGLAHSAFNIGHPVGLRWHSDDFNLVVERPVRPLHAASVEMSGASGHYVITWNGFTVATVNLYGDDVLAVFPPGVNSTVRTFLFTGVCLPVEYSWFIAMRILNKAQHALNGNMEGARVTRCYNCLKVGHIAKECTNPVKCKNCYGVGHNSAQCPSPVKQKDKGPKIANKVVVLPPVPKAIVLPPVPLPALVLPQPAIRFAEVPIKFAFEEEEEEEVEETPEQIEERRLAKGKSKEIPGPSGVSREIEPELRILNPRERHDKEDEIARKGGSLKAQAKGGRAGANDKLINQSIQRTNAEEAGARDAAREKKQELRENALPVLPPPLVPHDPTPQKPFSGEVWHTATFLWSAEGWKHSLEDSRFASPNGVKSLYWSVMLLIVCVLAFNLFTAQSVVGNHPFLIALECVLGVFGCYVIWGFFKNLLLIGIKLRKSVTVSVSSPDRNGSRLLSTDARPESMKNGQIKYESSAAVSRVTTEYSLQVDHFLFYMLFWKAEGLFPWDSWITVWDLTPEFVPYDRELLSHFLNPRSASATTKYSNVRTSLTIAASAHTATNIHRDETISTDPVNNTVRIACIVHGSNLERFQVAPGFQ